MSRALIDKLNDYLQGRADYAPRDLIRECRDALEQHERARVNEAELRAAGLSDYELAYMGRAQRDESE